MYKVGDKVVYPHHGAGTVVKREKREVLGEKREYLTIKILHNDMTVNVPADNAERVGLRKVIDEEAVKKVVKYLTSGGTEMPKNWNRRFKHNRDKMKTGDIYELAEVVRNLALRDGEKGLSTGEKQMYVKAKKILASELMYAKNMSEDEALEWLEMTLTEGAKPKLTPPSGRHSKKPAPPRRPLPRRPRARRACEGRRGAGRRGEEDDDGGEEARDAKATATVERRVLGRPRRRRARGAAWRGSAEGVRSPRRAAPAGGAAAPPRRERLDRRSRRRRAARVGGAHDPARGGARRVEGDGLRRRRRDARRLGSRRAWRRSPTTWP